MKNTAIKLFEEKQVRSVWDEAQEKWYFSIVDVVGILSNSANPNNYWKVLKHRLRKEGSELVTNCNQLKSHGQQSNKRQNTPSRSLAKAQVLNLYLSYTIYCLQ